MIYQDSEFITEKLFCLNPLNDVIVFHEEASTVNGISEEEIKSYPSAETVVPEIAQFLKEYAASEKLVFGGYNCGFDYGHLSALFNRYGYRMDDYFSGRLIDCYVLVQRASDMGLLPKTKNQKLGTMTKALDIPHDSAHSALRTCSRYVK